MAKATQIKMPDGSVVSADEFQSWVTGNQISGGPNSSWVNDAESSGTYNDPNWDTDKLNLPDAGATGSFGGTGTSGGSQNAQAAGASNANSTTSPPPPSGGNGSQAPGAKPDAGTIFPNTPATNSSTKTQSQFGQGPTESLQAWWDAVMANGMRNFGPADMNPNLAQNPQANSPYAQWFQSYYGNVLPQDAYLNSILSNDVQFGKNADGTLNSNLADYTQSEMQKMLSGLTDGTDSQVPTGSMASATQDLTSLDQMMQRQQSGNLDGMSAYQRAALGSLSGLKGAPGIMSLIDAQLQPVVGGSAMNYINEELQGLYSANQDQPNQAGNQAVSGTFLNQALKLLGLGGYN